MSTPLGPEVSFTVKELLQQMDERAEERAAELHRAIMAVDSKVATVSRRVETLEAERLRRAAVAHSLNRAWVIALGAIGVLVNIPALMYYLHA